MNASATASAASPCHHPKLRRAIAGALKAMCLINGTRKGRTPAG